MLHIRNRRTNGKSAQHILDKEIYFLRENNSSISEELRNLYYKKTNLSIDVPDQSEELFKLEHSLYKLELELRKIHDEIDRIRSVKKSLRYNINQWQFENNNDASHCLNALKKDGYYVGEITSTYFIENDNIDSIDDDEEYEDVKSTHSTIRMEKYDYNLKIVWVFILIIKEKDDNQYTTRLHRQIKSDLQHEYDKMNGVIL